MKRLPIHYAQCRIDPLNPPPNSPQTDVDVKQRDRNVQFHEAMVRFGSWPFWVNPRATCCFGRECTNRLYHHVGGLAREEMSRDRNDVAFIESPKVLMRTFRFLGRHDAITGTMQHDRRYADRWLAH